MKVCVIGDVILDMYPSSSKVKVSPESPVLDATISTPIEEWEARHGGAANVAENMAKLGCSVLSMGVVGDDPFGFRLANLTNNMKTHFLVVRDFMTTTKIRVMFGSHQVIRLSLESPPSFSREIIKSIVKDIPKDDDLIFVLVDYNKGMWTTAHSRLIIDAIGERTFYAMPKPENIFRFKGANAVVFNQLEYDAAMVLHGYPTEGENFIRDMGSPYTLVTQGEKGLTLHHASTEVGYHLDAHRVDVVDVCGAGDTAAAVFVYYLEKEKSVVGAVQMANFAGSLTVQKRGVRQVTLDELAEFKKELDNEPTSNK